MIFIRHPKNPKFLNVCSIIEQINKDLVNIKEERKKLLFKLSTEYRAEANITKVLSKYDGMLCYAEDLLEYFKESQKVSKNEEEINATTEV